MAHKEADEGLGIDAALKRIRQCRKGREPALSLEGLQLDALPAETFELDWITELNLGYLGLSLLPPEIGRLSELRSLNASGNEFSALPAEIGRLTKLENLSLADSDLDTLPPELAMTNLKDLDLYGNMMSDVPEVVWDLVALETLGLTQMGLSRLSHRISGLTSLKRLYLGYNQFTELPVEVFALPHLTGLFLHNNMFRRLPKQLGTLVRLRELTLGSNIGLEFPSEIVNIKRLVRLEFSSSELRTVPDEIGSLVSLENLSLNGNELKELPASMAKLGKLTDLGLSNNEFEEVPRVLFSMPQLSRLSLNNNRIETIPDAVSALTNLEHLGLSENRIAALPGALAELPMLRSIEIADNPLPASYYDSLAQGVDSLWALLRSLQEATQPLFEAKLLVTGEGKVGKSWALAALRGADPEEEIGDDNTTWGIDRNYLLLPHPEIPGAEIVLNSWDFGGQRIYRVTHQFFFSEQAIYLLVWNPRAGAEQCRVNEWLRTIALRTGSQLQRTSGSENVSVPKAKVIMVATHAKDEGGSYIADYGKSGLDQDLRQMIVDEIEIDSRKGFHVEELKAKIALHAANLPGMGEPLNTNWAAAREATLALRETRPRISFREFSAICASHGVEDHEQQRALAWTYLHSLGRAIWYGDAATDDEENGDAILSDTIILDAVWLSRAFVQILDDGETIAAGGMLDHRRLRQIWTDHGRPEWHRYAPEEYGILKQVMRRFDVALPTRESHGRRSLVPQLVPHAIPKGVPWLTADAAPGPRTIRMRCDLDFEAIGLMPRLIAATEPWHVYTHGVGLFWERGLFLRDSASFNIEGLIMQTAVERPRIEVVVSGDRPDFLMHQFFRAFEVVLGFWKGMTREYLIGCPTVGGNGEPCSGYFKYGSIVRRITERVDTPFNCQVCDANWPAERLIGGFEAMMVDDRYMLHHLYHRDQILAPSICLLEPADRRLLRVTSWAGFVGKRFKLTLVSELSGKPVASKEFTLTRTWVKWVRPVTRVASFVLTGAALPLGGDLASAFKEESSVLDKLSSLPEEDGAPAPVRELRDTKDLRLTPNEIANFAAFLQAIGLDPRQHGMDIARAPDGQWLWMSPDEVRIYKPQAAA